MEKISFNSPQEVENFHLKQGRSKNFCLAPFTTLLLEPDGKVGACRHKGCEFPVGHLESQSIDEIWNGTFIKKWRKEFLDGSPQICSSEVENVHCHQCPSYSSIIEKSDIHLHQTKGPLRIAFNFNGHCNLECKMCHIWQKPNGYYDSINFWSKIPDLIRDLEEVELLSGEPFIQKDTYRLIDLISNHKKEAFWTFTTNGNWNWSEYISKKLDQINIKHIILSLDSLNPETYKKIRIKGDLNRALNTLNQLKQYNLKRAEVGLTSFKIIVNFLIQKDNWQELGEFQNFSDKTNTHIFRTFLKEPFEHSLLSLDIAERKKILDWYLKNLSKKQIENGIRVIKPLISSLPKIDQFNYLLSFKETIHE